MIWPFKRREVIVLYHWYALIEQFQTSTQEFYNDIEKELEVRKIPGLEVTRELFREGGLLSDQREYLRLTRERLVFDICAAPFGTGYFFTCRFAEIPAVVKLWQLITLFALLYALVAGSLTLTMDFFGPRGLFVWPFLFAAAVILIIYLFRNALALGMRGLDGTLLRIPVIGVIYEAWFRPDTYYRKDTRLMYVETVPAIVKTLAEEITAANGAHLLNQHEHAPILSQFKQPRRKQTFNEAEPTAAS